MVFSSLLHVNWSSGTEFQKKASKKKIRSLLLNTFGRQEHVFPLHCGKIQHFYH